MGYICEQILEGDGSNGGIKSKDSFHAKDLYSAISEKGPLRVKSKESPYVVIIDANKCECAEDGCERIMFGFHLNNGVFKKYYLFDDLFISKFNSIGEVVDHLVSGCVADSYGERLHIEALAEKTFGCHYSEVNLDVCYCEDCAAKIGSDNLWRKIVVAQLCGSLVSRDNIICKSRSDFGDEAAEWIEVAFDIGYLAGRQFSEYYVKNDMEMDVMNGRKQETAKKKAGEKGSAASKRDRTSRRTALLKAMEQLAQMNPDLPRLGERVVAGMALQDCAKADPRLWAQGKNQIDQYLTEIRLGEAGPDAKARYHDLFPPETA